jgi:hypothetical protein
MSSFIALNFLADHIARTHISRFSKLVACFGLASCLALTACTSVKVKLGMKVYLEKIPITSMQATLPKGPGVAPGEKSPLVVAFAQPNGKVLQTEGQGQGSLERPQGDCNGCQG